MNMSETQHDWAESLEAELPENVTECAGAGLVPPEIGRIRVLVSVQQWPDGEAHRHRPRLTDTLLDIMQAGANELGLVVLPPAPQEPLDFLRCQKRRGRGWSEPLLELQTPLWLALVNGCSRHFAIEFRLAIKINSKWGVAPAPEMTPRELATLFGFDPTQYSLYRASSAELLPPDTPLLLKRGDCFEAQKDGKYGLRAVPPPRGLQTIDDDVATLAAAGFQARLAASGGQRYVEVRGLTIPSPPWSDTEATILVAVPETYPKGGLDALYLEQTVTRGGSIPYQQSVTSIDGRSWGLISWHYADGKTWNPNCDDLASHIAHCRGFFLARGVR